MAAQDKALLVMDIDVTWHLPTLGYDPTVAKLIKIVEQAVASFGTLEVAGRFMLRVCSSQRALPASFNLLNVENFGYAIIFDTPAHQMCPEVDGAKPGKIGQFSLLMGATLFRNIILVTCAIRLRSYIQYWKQRGKHIILIGVQDCTPEVLINAAGGSSYRALVNRNPELKRILEDIVFGRDAGHAGRQEELQKLGRTLVTFIWKVAEEVCISENNLNFLKLWFDHVRPRFLANTLLAEQTRQYGFLQAARMALELLVDYTDIVEFHKGKHYLYNPSSRFISLFESW